MRDGRFIYRVGDANYKFSYDRQCLVRADLFAAELLSKAADEFGEFEIEDLIAPNPPDRTEQGAKLLAEDEIIYPPAQPVEPVRSPAESIAHSLETIDDAIWDLEFVQEKNADNGIRVEALRYCRSMVLAQDLGCHFLNFLESPNAI
jgi:hypothetical protein